MPVDPQIGKVHVSNVTLSIGLFSTLGGIYTIPKTNAGEEEKTQYICPSCDEPHEFPEQVYRCRENAAHGPFTSRELARGKEIDGKIVKLDAEAIAEAKVSVLPERALELQVHRREDVFAHTFPKGTAYVFIPQGTGPLSARLLVDLIKGNPELCLVAKTNLRKKDAFLMLDVELNDQLVLREMMWPEDMKHFPAVQGEAPDKKNLQLAQTLLEASLDDFVPDEYRKDSRDRIQALVDEAGDGAPKTKAEVKREKKSSNEDLTSILEAAIAAKKRKAS